MCKCLTMTLHNVRRDREARWQKPKMESHYGAAQCEAEAAQMHIMLKYDFDKMHKSSILFIIYQHISGDKNATSITNSNSECAAVVHGIFRNLFNSRSVFRHDWLSFLMEIGFRPQTALSQWQNGRRASGHGFSKACKLDCADPGVTSAN